MKKLNKNFALSVVALILAVCMLTGVTYTWINAVTSVSILSPGNPSELSIDSDSNSVVKLQSEGDVINLGSYFNKSGNMCLTACSSDGKEFYFKSGDGVYRRGTANDVNVNYISCTFKVVAESDDMVLWLNELPELIDNTTGDDISSKLRCAITVDDETTVFANGGSYNRISDTTGTLAQCAAVKPADYEWNSSLESGAGSNNYVCVVNKGTEETRTINIKLWLEDPDTTTINSHDLSVKMSLIATLNKQTIYFKDSTFSANGTNLISDQGAFYMCLADDVDTYWSFARESGSEPVYKVEIPIIYRNKEVNILRCSGDYGTGSNNLDGGTINYDYKWSTTLPQAVQDATYSAIGALAGSTNNQTGIWKDTTKVYVDDQYGIDLSTTKMLLTDKNTGQADNMYYNEAKGYWVGYVATDSKKVMFTSKATGVTDNNWGYHADTSNQEKPATSNTYTIYDKKDGSWDTNQYLSSYSLKGSFNNWHGTPMYCIDKTANTAYASVKLDKGTHTFKIYSNNSETWYGDGKTYTFGSASSTSEKSITLTNNKAESNNTTITINSTGGGTVLFVYNGTSKALSLKYMPSLPAEGDVRTYIMLKSSWNDWLKYINHWDASSSDVAIAERSVTSVGTYDLTHTYNCYTVADGAWSKGSGSWSFKEGAKDKLYLKPNANWKTDSARFAAYFFDGSSTEKWVSMTASSESGVYMVTIPSGGYKSVIFCRMNPSTTSNNWPNTWNQTSDLTIPTTTQTVTYNLYYVDMDKDATQLQWVNADKTCCPDQNPNNSYNGYSMGTPLNGAMYYMIKDSADDGCGVITSNRQTAPTSLKVNGSSSAVSTTVGTKLTFSATVATNGTAYKDKYVSYFVTNTATGTTRMVGAEWTPLRPGTYTVKAYGDDRYIPTEASSSITITVK